MIETKENGSETSPPVGARLIDANEGADAEAQRDESEAKGAESGDAEDDVDHRPAHDAPMQGLAKGK